MGIVRLGFAGGRDAEAEKAGIESFKLRFDRAVVEQILMHHIAQLRVLLIERRAAHALH